jgi:hypothetical protein
MEFKQMSENLLKIEIKSSAPHKREREFFEGIIDQLEQIAIIEGSSVPWGDGESAAGGVIQSAKKYFAENPIDETVELPANIECKVLSIGLVQEAITEATGKTAHVSLRQYGIPDTFLRQAVPGFDHLPHNYLPGIIKFFESTNPIAALDARQMFTVQSNLEE